MNFTACEVSKKRVFLYYSTSFPLRDHPQHSSFVTNYIFYTHTTINLKCSRVTNLPLYSGAKVKVFLNKQVKQYYIISYTFRNIHVKMKYWNLFKKAILITLDWEKWQSYRKKETFLYLRKWFYILSRFSRRHFSQRRCFLSFLIKNKWSYDTHVYLSLIPILFVHTF